MNTYILLVTCINTYLQTDIKANVLANSYTLCACARNSRERWRNCAESKVSMFWSVQLAEVGHVIVFPDNQMASQNPFLSDRHTDMFFKLCSREEEKEEFYSTCWVAIRIWSPSLLTLGFLNIHLLTVGYHWWVFVHSWPNNYLLKQLCTILMILRRFVTWAAH